MTSAGHLSFQGILQQRNGGGGRTRQFFITITGRPGRSLSNAAEQQRSDGKTRGFGSVKVRACIGDTFFETSVFPGKRADEWLLPVKADVRAAEEIGPSDRISLTLQY